MSTEQQEDRPWNDISFITRSQYREQVVADLDKHGPGIPRELADATDASIASISQALKSLRDRGLIKLLVDEDQHKGRIYALTDHGENVAAHVTEVARE